MGKLLFALFLAGCSGGGGEQCSAFGAACVDGGTIEQCCSSSLCHYKTSDGTDFPCAGTNCATATPEVRAWCQSH